MDAGTRSVTSPSEGRLAALGAAIEVRPPREGAARRILELARRVLHCRGAIVSLVDEEHRPFVAAASGLPDELTTWWGRTPLSISLAQPAGTDDEALVIEDLGQHPLLLRDDAVRELGIVSYMGCPLIHEPDGSLGSLVVVHDERRSWSEDDVRNLRDLASLVVTEVELRGVSRRQEDTRRRTAERTAAETRRDFAELVDGLDAIVSERDPVGGGAFTFVSRRAEELLGHPLGRWLEEPDFWESVLLHPDDRKRAVRTLDEALAAGRDVDQEYRVRRANGATLWMRELVKVVAGGSGRRPLARGVMVDVTRQKEAQREAERTARALRLLHEVARDANDSERVLEPLASAVGRICEHMGWSVGHAWAVADGGRDVLEPTGIWHPADPGPYEPLRRLTDESRPRRGEGLAGRVLETGEPQWTEIRPGAGERSRLRAARACGLRAGFAFPVLVGREVVAVLEFFVERPLEPDDRLLELAGHLGQSLGRAVERGRAARERAEREDEGRKRRRQLQEAQRLAAVGSWEWDPRSGALEWTEELYRIFGIDPDGGPITYEAYRGRIHPDDAHELERVIAEAVRSGTPYTLEHRIVRPDGQVREVLSRGEAESDEEGEVVRLIGTAQDITERKELERSGRRLESERAARAEAEAARERIRGILESITDAFFAVDREWRLTHLNSAGSRLLGNERERLIGEVLWDVAPDLGETVLFEVLLRSLEQGEPLEVEERIEPLERWFEIRAYPTGDGLSVYLHDIDDRKRVEGALRASEARYRFLADAVPQQIWTARPDGALSYVNRVVTEYFGRTAEDLEGGGFEGFVHPDDRESYVEGWGRAREVGEPFEAELRIRRHDGEHRWHLLRALAQREEGGRITRWFGSTTDVHDRKEAEQERDRALDDLERVNYVLESDRSHLERQAQELRRTARALQQSNEELDQFAYVASHDLKAPLRGIANLASWLEEDLRGQLDPETREYLDLLQSRVHRMESLINGILQYSRAGRMGEEPVEVDVGALVGDVVDMVSPPEGTRIEIDPHLPVLRSPRAPLEQVLLNLVSNGVKHADADDPVVRIGLSDEGADLVELSVSDNGAGIDPAYHEKIFTIFQTLRPTDEEGGTGIGLAVVKKLVERFGGQVWVESEEGSGATFRFLWPREVTDGD